MVVKHRGNMKRLRNGTENEVGDGMLRQFALKGLHLLAVGMWFGSGAFFIFVAATPIFEAFREVVNKEAEEGKPNYRTGNVPITPAGEEERKNLASGLAGTAVGPLFPRFFALSAVCAAVAVVTAEGFRRMKRTRVQRVRLWLCVVGLVLVAGGWPLSEYVAQLNAQRFDNPEAKKLFFPLHGISLLGSGITTLVAGAVLAMGGMLPSGMGGRPHPPAPSP